MRDSGCDVTVNCICSTPDGAPIRPARPPKAAQGVRASARTARSARLRKGAATYGAIAQSAWERFADRLSGSADGVVGVIGEHALSPAARTAIENSARALGFGEHPCFFCSLRERGAADGEPLTPAELFALIEGLDPVVLVIADSPSIRAVSDAYRANVAPLARSRVLGRTAVAFRSFESMLAAPDDKQRAWAVLKLLRS